MLASLMQQLSRHSGSSALNTLNLARARFRYAHFQHSHVNRVGGNLARAVPVRQDAQPAGSSAAALGLSSDLQSALEAFHISQLTEVQVLSHTSRPVQAVFSHVDVVPHV